ncbi:hypothetical protein [Spirosoma agri]|uniref:Lipoprotein n=2 Tax=Spirosoma agri TaxID=1987381 RepID=A0A6M0IJR1_9BACT|nr:hypothetical protein [Spirosoma agri]
MKNAALFFLTASLLAACGHTERTTKNTSSPLVDSAVVTSPKPKNCLSLIEPEKLGKANDYQESAKSIKVALTLEKDTSTTETAGGCYFNNTVTVLATKKSGSQLFKRTLLKDDLLYFTKSDDVINRSVLQNTTYKPTFNGQKYITLTMSLRNPDSKKTANYIVFMNYFGEIVKVR